MGDFKDVVVDIMEAYDNGYSVEEIAEQFKFSEDEITKIICKYAEDDV